MSAEIWVIIILAVLLIIAILKIISSEKFADKQAAKYCRLQKKYDKDTATLGEAVEEQQRKILRLENANYELFQENKKVRQMYDVSEAARIRLAAERGGNE